MWKHQDMKAFKHQGGRESQNSAQSGKDKAHMKGSELEDCEEAGVLQLSENQ